MSAKPNFELSADLSGIERRFSAQALQAKQAAFARRVAFDMRDKVPVDTGALRDSEPVSSDYENGLIVWNTPYAQDVYNADRVRTVRNPNAVPHWAEASKAEKLGDWEAFAAALLGEGML